MSRMLGELSRKTRKLEVRLEEFLKEEERSVKELRGCLEKLNELNACEISEMKPKPEKIEEMVRIQF